jgi:hypothetical protein
VTDAAPTPEEWAMLRRENSAQAESLIAIRKEIKIACINLVRRNNKLDTSWPIYPAEDK